MISMTFLGNDCLSNPLRQHIECYRVNVSIILNKRNYGFTG